MPEKKIEIPQSLAEIVEFLADSQAGSGVLQKAEEILKGCGTQMTEKSRAVVANALKMLDSVKAEIDPETWDKLQESAGLPKPKAPAIKPEDEDKVETKGKTQKAEDVELAAFAKSIGEDLTEDNKGSLELAYRVSKAQSQASNKRIADLEEQVRKSRQEKETEVLRKSVAVFEGKVPAPVDDLLEILKALPVASVAKFRNLLDKTAEAISKGGLVTEMGSGGSEPASAWAEIEAKAKAMAAGSAGLSMPDAIHNVLKAEPALYERFETERISRK